MIRVAVVAAAIITTPAFAKDLPVTDQDQAAIQQICEAAARSPAIAIDLNAQIAAWCVQWRGRVHAANVTAPATAPPNDQK